ncbi:MAG: M48 family metallopeptidase [Gemmatimonadaceae bacterium]
MSQLLRERRPLAVLCLAASFALSVGAGSCASADQVPVDQERELGAQLAAQTAAQLPMVQDAGIDQFVSELGELLVRNADTTGRHYTFYVVDSPVANAFAIPGGYVFINRGILDLADEADEVAGVMAHEIGHVVRRHSLRQMAKAQNTQNAVGIVYALLHRNPGAGEQVALQVAGSALMAKYSRRDETEADEVGLIFMTRAHFDPHGMPRFFEKLAREERRRPALVAQWFASHPATAARIADTDSLIARLPADAVSRTVRDVPQFGQMKARLAQLPPPPPDPTREQRPGEPAPNRDRVP